MQNILGNTDFKYNKSDYDIETIFSIHEDLRGNAVFNLNETLYFSMPVNMLKRKILDHPLHWSTISYEIYGTTRLAWFLMKLNNIPLDKAFIRVPPATSVFYIDAEKIELLLSRIKKDIAKQ